ncbi:MAG: hypothetical protein AB7G93_17010 [Bdellovibrionales bacterium]
MKTQFRLLLALGILILTGCGSPGKSALVLASESLDNLGCKLSQSEMWNTLHRLAEDGGEYPTAPELKTALIQIGSERGYSGEKFESYVNAFVDHYDGIISGIRQHLAPTDSERWKKAFAELEIGIRVTSVHDNLQKTLQASRARLALAEKDLDARCVQPDPPAPTDDIDPDSAPPAPGPSPTPPFMAFRTIWEQLEAAGRPEILGLKQTLATAYQSCDVLTLPPMTSQTASVRGVEIVGRHPQGGQRRKIASLASVNASHYYIQGQRLAKNSCFEVRNDPMIYDFGGKPYTTSRSPAELNMFKNGGSGEPVLGVDCSALVFSALALAGLKMDPDPEKPLKASLVHGIGSRAFKEPQSNGMRCLQKITLTRTTSLLPGDVIAINGHVVMVDDMGEDPFGLDEITRAADCNANQISYNRFDFVIAQSSPSKGGIGINRYLAKDYLKESSTFREGLTRYAVAACRARFGLSPNLNSPDLSVVRHKKTKECLDQRLVATNAACVDSCPPL